MFIFIIITNCKPLFLDEIKLVNYCFFAKLPNILELFHVVKIISNDSEICLFDHVSSLTVNNKT